jgi:hypothetical protein
MGRPFKTADREALVWKTGLCKAFSTINYYTGQCLSKLEHWITLFA